MQRAPLVRDLSCGPLLDDDIGEVLGNESQVLTANVMLVDFTDCVSVTNPTVVP